jgi:hypothetical protein
MDTAISIYASEKCIALYCCRAGAYLKCISRNALLEIRCCQNLGTDKDCKTKRNGTRFALTFNNVVKDE